MRELITRYGRKNIGFLWLFVEPLLVTLVITVAWTYIKADKFSTLNIIAFMITGYPIAMMWRNASNRALGAISANLSLLYHRNVKVLDTIFTRVLLEVAGASIAQILLMATFIAIGWIDMHTIYSICFVPGY
ncbi:Polysialic acid transport protein kpsM [Mannheimia haemolytica]|uniref:Polysialic acid transport protein kpsM n=1 Tax=Mannheimia haemolytica TaxID=75985 RepID=A0A378MVT8_MANHA|nr:Polysialic acid transport protein kpsM [Mannheimia haemolytica]